MRRIATGDTEAEKSAVKSAPRSDKGTGSWLKVHWCLVSLAVIMVLAFVLRVVFAYGISAGDDYALSGGTSASSHLRIVIELLAGTYDPSSQPQLNYPYGIESVSGPLYDYIMAGFAYLVTLCGVSDSTAASGARQWGRRKSEKGVGHEGRNRRNRCHRTLGRSQHEGLGHRGGGYSRNAQIHG